MLRFEPLGIAFAHLTLPPDGYAREAEAVTTAARELGDVCSGVHVSYLTGQSDVMVQLALSDFRAAFELNYSSRATGSNWLFAVPYADQNIGDVPSSELALNYVLHLRLNRRVYHSGSDAEENVIAAIRALVSGRVTARILAGFGWSDLIVIGRFSDASDVRNFVRSLQHMESDQGIPVFRRVLTLVSYDTEIEPSLSSHMKVTPLLLGRALPTHIREASDVIGTHNVGAWRTLTLDGKWDILSIPQNPADGIPIRDFIARHKALAITGTPLGSYGIERLETHLLATDIPSDPLRRESASGERARPLDASCNCAALLEQTHIQTLIAECRPELPSALVLAIRNVLNLLHTASRDSVNCCDITASLRRCEVGLGRLLQNYRHLTLRMDGVSRIDTSATSPSTSSWYRFVVKARQDIAEWCTYAERIVSQRTVGRFEEFLAQNERVVSYRGGVQKLLYLTDELLNNYAKRVLADTEEPTFMSLFDPVDIVFAMRVVGFVRVPVRYLFVLPLTVTHLWHEVGVYRYHTKYLLPHDSRTKRRLEENARRAKRDDSDAHIDMILDVADSYGDAVTLMYGFGGDLRKFFLSLATAQFEQSDFRLARSQKGAYVTYLLTRLYVLLEFRHAVELVRFHMTRDFLQISREEIEEWEPDFDEFVQPAMGSIVETLRDELLRHPRYNAIVIDERMIARALNNIGETVKAVHRPYLRELAFEVAALPLPEPLDVEEKLQKVMAGELVQLDSGREVDELFLRMQHELIARLLPLTPAKSLKGLLSSGGYFASIGALVRSSILSFYQQDQTGEKDGGGSRTLPQLRPGDVKGGSIPDLDMSG